MSVREKRGESSLTDAEKVKLAEDNHLWLNALACVRPSPAFAQQVGEEVLRLLDESPIVGDFGDVMPDVTIGKVLYLRVNKS